MVKNEKYQIERTIDSCRNNVDGFIFLDTGSSDGTPEIITEICNKHHIIFYLYHAQFVDFSTTRNYLSECAKKHAKYLLLLDANDELRNGEFLKKYVTENSDFDVFVIQCILQNKQDKQVLPRNAIIKSTKNVQFRYSVQEELVLDDCKVATLQETGIYIYQDIEKDKSSVERYGRDLKLLHWDYKKDPQDIHALFCLGQTYRAIGKNLDSLKFFELYLQNKPLGRYETHKDDLFWCYIYTVELLLILKIVNWKNKIIHHLNNCISYVNDTRMEPYYYYAMLYYFLGTELEHKQDERCVRYYLKTKDYLQQALKINKPTGCRVYSEQLYLEIPKKLQEIAKLIDKQQ
uniref:Glycosyl transferase family 2 n=1 Tax=Marseillevirus LCMAC201 TaxID=2506605 RepID=A0A481YVN0_9VIRU|nr:MAG: glycosyl transferase family 2 [Marseillevirus LCMAC201]